MVSKLFGGGSGGLFGRMFGGGSGGGQDFSGGPDISGNQDFSGADANLFGLAGELDSSSAGTSGTSLLGSLLGTSGGPGGLFGGLFGGSGGLFGGLFGGGGGGGFGIGSIFTGLLGLIGLFDEGAWEVPRDMPAVVHAGEMIVPVADARALRGSPGFRDMVSPSTWTGPSFALGAWEIDRDMIAKIHAGEAIVPAGFASAARARGFGLPGSQGPAQSYEPFARKQGAGDVHLHMGFYGPSDAASVPRWLAENRGAVRQALFGASDLGF
jgi:hypothetical protein